MKTKENKVKRLIKLIRCGDEFVEVEKDYVLKDNEVDTKISRMVDIDEEFLHEKYIKAREKIRERKRKIEDKLFIDNKQTLTK